MPVPSPSSAEGIPSQLPTEDELRPETDPMSGLDLSLTRENLRRTPWERLLDNDDTASFCDMARSGLKHHHAAA